MKASMIVVMIIILLCINHSNAFQLKKFSSSMKLRSKSNDDSSINSNDKNELIIGTTGTVANLICGYSLYVLKNTGCGLPAGPFGIEGALEGISYLEIVAIVCWSLITKVQTGGGLNEGPYGSLGLSEGLSYLTIIGGVAIAYFNLNDYGFLPGFLPNDQCFGINN